MDGCPRGAVAHVGGRRISIRSVPVAVLCPGAMSAAGGKLLSVPPACRLIYPIPGSGVRLGGLARPPPWLGVNARFVVSVASSPCSHFCVFVLSRLGTRRRGL